MKKLFINNPLFILICPVVSGIILYLVILLYHNEVSNVLDLYADGEIVVCIFLAFLIQEITRRSFNFLFVRRDKKLMSGSIALHLIISLVSTVVLVGVLVHYFYLYAYGFAPDIFDLLLFIILYGILSFFYTGLMISHSYLSYKNVNALQRERDIKNEVSREFHQFRKGINPDLLFESLEALLVMIENDNPQTEELLDSMSIIYRYILAKRSIELIAIQEEIDVARELVQLFSFMPSAQVKLEVVDQLDSHIIPGTLLSIIELIIKKSITSHHSNATIDITQHEEGINISFKTLEKLNTKIELNDLQEITASYAYYSDKEVNLRKEEESTTIELPILKQIKTESTSYESTDHRG